MSHIDDINYARDPRNCERATAPTIIDDDGNEVELPMRFAVCPVCEGRGTHVNPAIDAGGLSGEDMEDPEFRKGYQRGDYDVACNSCQGRRVVPVPDLDRMTADQINAWERAESDRMDFEMERMAEIRAGA